MKRCQRPGRIDLENRAVPQSAIGCRAVEDAVARLDQPGLRIIALTRQALTGQEAFESGQRPRRINPENRAVPRRAAAPRRAVEAAVAALGQAAGRRRAVTAVEPMER